MKMAKLIFLNEKVASLPLVNEKVVSSSVSYQKWKLVAFEWKNNEIATF